MGHYKKTLEEGTFEYQFYKALGFPPIYDESPIPLVVRITIGDMGLLDGFYLPLPASADRFSIEDMLKRYVLCENQEDRLHLKERLSMDPNPDLIDIYDALLEIYSRVESKKATISYHINNGNSNISPSDPVSAHLQSFVTDDSQMSYRLLDLVLEIYDEADPFSGLTEEQKSAMLREFRGYLTLYFIDRFGYQPKLDEVSPELAERFDALLRYLSSEDMIHIEDKARLTITYKGYDLLKDIINEAEFYIDNYDIFGDVYVKRFKEIRFNTGCGNNLIVPVLLRDGLSPYRVLFICALYLGNMDELAFDPHRLFSDEPFRELFSLIVNSPTEEEIGARLLDRIIREGKERIEEQRKRFARLERVSAIMRRINEIDESGIC